MREKRTQFQLTKLLLPLLILMLLLLLLLLSHVDAVVFLLNFCHLCEQHVLCSQVFLRKRKKKSFIFHFGCGIFSFSFSSFVSAVVVFFLMKRAFAI